MQLWLPNTTVSQTKCKFSISREAWRILNEQISLRATGSTPSRRLCETVVISSQKNPFDLTISKSLASQTFISLTTIDKANAIKNDPNDCKKYNNPRYIDDLF